MGEPGEEAVDGPLEVGDVALELRRTGACTRSRARAGPVAGAGCSRSPARGSAATGDRRAPTTSGGVGRSRSSPVAVAGQRPDLHQRLLRPERSEPVGRRAAVHRQDEEVGEALEELEVEPRACELVEVGDVGAPVTVPLDHRVVERPLPLGHRPVRVGGQLDVAEALGDGHVVGVHHPGHALAHGPQVLGGRRRRRPAASKLPACGSPYRVRDHELRVALGNVVRLHERLDGQLPVHRQPAGVPPLGPQRLHLPRVEAGGERLEAAGAAAGRRGRG